MRKRRIVIFGVISSLFLLISGCCYVPTCSRYPYYGLGQTYSTSDYAFYRVPTYPYYRVPVYPGGQWWGGWFPYGQYGYDVVDYVPARTAPVVVRPVLIGYGP